MTDRELLEKAAKAAGIPYDALPHSSSTWVKWNPLTDDGDALRLAVKLRIDIVHFSDLVRADVNGLEDCHEQNGIDPYAATRRAIVRAAATIGEAL